MAKTCHFSLGNPANIVYLTVVARVYTKAQGPLPNMITFWKYRPSPHASLMGWKGGCIFCMV